MVSQQRLGGWGQDPSPQPCPMPWGEQGWQPHSPTHQHVYTLHSRGVHPPGFKGPVCPEMALQSGLLGEGRQGQSGCDSRDGQFSPQQPAQQAPRPSSPVPERHPSQTGGQNQHCKWGWDLINA